MNEKSVWIEGVDYLSLRRHILPLKENIEDLERLTDQIKSILHLLPISHPERECRRIEEVHLHLRGLTAAIKR